MNRIHEVYGGGETDAHTELVPGEIARGTMEKWRQSGIVLACLTESPYYAYDPEFQIHEGIGDPPTTHCVWAGSREKGSWRLMKVERQFNF